MSCGSGVKQRSIECSDKDIRCDARTKPQTTAPCNLQTCPQWTTSPWGEVSICFLKSASLHFVSGIDYTISRKSLK